LRFRLLPLLWCPVGVPNGLAPSRAQRTFVLRPGQSAGGTSIPQGPILIFDKSLLESLNLDEAILLDNFYMSNITPPFFVECLADLEKSIRSRSTPEQLVGSFAELSELSVKPTHMVFAPPTSISKARGVTSLFQRSIPDSPEFVHGFGWSAV
jgi:hypothetical protein